MKIIGYILLAMALASTVYAYALLDLHNVQVRMLDMLVAANLFWGSVIVLECLSRGTSTQLTLLVYTLSFLTFNLGSYVFTVGRPRYGEHLFYRVNTVSYENEAYGLLVINVAMASYFAAYLVVRHLKRHRKDTAAMEPNTALLRFWSRAFMLFGMGFAFLKAARLIVYVMQHGYLSIYMSNLYNNAFIDLFDSFYAVGFWGYLATMPSPRERRGHVAVFVIYAFLTLLTGKRGDLVVHMLTIVWWFAKTGKRSGGMLPRAIILGVVCLVAFSFMYQFGLTRSLSDWRYTSITGDFVRFINSLGGSGRLTALSLEYKDSLLEWGRAHLVLHPIIKFVKNNAVVRVLGGGYSNFLSFEALREAGPFGDIITYLSNPEAFFQGGGLGSNYLTELYISGGMSLVVLFNVVLGLIIHEMDHVMAKKWAGRAFIASSMQVLVFMPRASTFDIVPNSLVPVIMLVLISMLSGKVLRKSHSGPRNLDTKLGSCKV